MYHSNQRHYRIHVLFHNLKYDKSIVFKSLVYHSDIRKKFSILVDNSQNFMSSPFDKLHFIDNLTFMPSSLDLPEDDSSFLTHISKGDDYKLQFLEKYLFPL